MSTAGNALATATSVAITDALIGNVGSNPRQVPLSLLDQRVNVRLYGAKGDAKKVTDAVLTNASATVTSATAAFTAADVGKVIWGTSGTSTVLTKRTITARNSATSITVSSVASSSTSSVKLVWGTDDTAAIQAAGVAAKAAQQAVYLPAGGYVFSSLLFDFQYSALTPSPAIIGDGSGHTILYPTSDFDATTVAANSSFVLNTANAYRSRVAGLTIDGSSAPFSGTSKSVLKVPQKSYVDDVWVINFVGMTAGLTITGPENLVHKVHVENCDYEGIAANAAGVTFLECYTGNNAYGLFVTQINGDSNTAYYVRYIGGTIDECSAAATYLESSTDVTFIGVKLFGGATSGTWAAIVDGASKGKFIGCEIVPFGTGNRSGLKVLASGQATLIGNRIASSGTGVPINNAGTIYDAGGNTISAGTPTNTGLILPARQLLTKDSITAFATGGQTSATALAVGFNRVSTVATTADSVKLPTSAAGLDVTVVNSGANSMQVFGTSPDTINDVATATGVAQAAGKTARYVCITAGSWFQLLSA